MPKWVQSICKRFLKPDAKMVDLVGDDKMQASTSVRHMQLPCSYPQRAQLLKDLITSYGAGGRTIVFTDSKKEAAELSVTLGDSLGAQVRRRGRGAWGARGMRCICMRHPGWGQPGWMGHPCRC